MMLNALYVGVTDMQRALTFYKAVFRSTPVQIEDRLSMFDLGGAYFGLFYATYNGEALVLGNHCVPNIEVEDIEAEYERVGALAAEIDTGIRQVKDYRYFQFKDTEGNIVELYAVCPERAAEPA